jgi:hypothetical protein
MPFTLAVSHQIPDFQRSYSLNPGPGAISAGCLNSEVVGETDEGYVQSRNNFFGRPSCSQSMRESAYLSSLPPDSFATPRRKGDAVNSRRRILDRWKNLTSRARGGRLCGRPPDSSLNGSFRDGQ